jgi:hypothetical protein
VRPFPPFHVFRPRLLDASRLTHLRVAWRVAALGPKSQGSLVPVMVYVHGGRLEFLSNATYEWKNFVASTNQVT